jgi:hypothetical protein
MMSVIPELFNEQYLLKYLDNFHNDTKICQIELNLLSIEGYSDLKLEHPPIYTDGKYVIIREDRKFYTKALLYAVIVNDDTKQLSLKFYRDLCCVEHISMLNKRQVKIVNNLLYILQHNYIFIIDIRDDSKTTIELDDYYDDLDVISGKIFLTKNDKEIMIYENAKVPQNLVRHGYNLTIQYDKILSYKHKHSMLVIDEFIGEEWVERISIPFKKDTKYEVFITYINQNLVFICHSCNIYIFRGGDVFTVSRKGVSHENNVVADKYGKRAIINFTKLYDILSGKMYDLKSGTRDFVYI